MILDKYIITNLLLFITFCFYGIDVQAQNQTILIFDPHQVSNNFQNSFHQSSEDSIYIADTIDEKINNYDALFLFIDYPYILSRVEGNSLIEYLNLNKPIYLSTKLYFQNIDSVAFWNHIGINWYAELLIEVHVNYVVGVDTAFTKEIFIDTSFISGGIPYIEGEVAPILDGIDTVSINLSTTFMPANESLNVIIDLYNLIHHPEFLKRVLIHFGLKEPNSVIDENYDQLNTLNLYQNYPNPFNPTTSIQYAVGSMQFVQLKVYDVLGNEIATLVNEEKPAGNFEVEFDARNLTSGIYFYQLRAGEYLETRKMILLR